VAKILDTGCWMLDKIRDDIRFEIEYQGTSTSPKRRRNKTGEYVKPNIHTNLGQILVTGYWIK